MPKKYSWYQGWLSEIIAESILSKYCFTTLVPVRSDVGIDLFCVLFHEEIDKKINSNPNLIPGSMFAIQVKSNTRPIVISKHQAQYFAALDIPVALGIVNQEKSSISLISMQQLLHFREKYGAFDVQDDFKVKLILRKEYSEKEYKENFLAIMPQEGITLVQLLNDKKYNGIIKHQNKSKLIPISVGPEICNFSIENDFPDSHKKLKDWVNSENDCRDNIKRYMPKIPLNFSNGKSRLISYYNEENYERGIYPRIVTYLELLNEHANKATKIRYSRNDKKMIKTFLDFCDKRKNR